MLWWKYNRAYLATTTTTTHLFMKKSMQFAKVASIFAYNAYITLTNCTTITIFGLMYIFALCIFTNNMANKFNFYIVCARAATCAYSAHFPQLVRISVYTAYYMIFSMCAYTMQYERFSPHIPPFSIVLTCIYLFTLAQCRNHIWNNSIFKIECAYYCIYIGILLDAHFFKEQLGIYNVRIQCRNSRKY